MNIATFQKEPNAVTIFEIDWTDFLGGETVSSSSWTVPSGIVGVPSNDTTHTFIKVSGGTWQQEYELVNHIVASDGSEADRSITIAIQQTTTYCTISECRRAAQKMTESALPPATDELVRELIDRVSRLLDREVGVSDGYFNPPLYPFASPRTFYGDGTNYLKIDPYVAGSLGAAVLPAGWDVPTFIERDGYAVITSTDGFVPIPGLSWGIPSGLPNPGWYQGMPIQLTAQWGFSSTPSDVKLAVIEWVINVWRETDPAGLKLIGMDGQVLREAMPPRVGEVVNRWHMRTGVMV